MDETDLRLLSEQLHHALDLLNARIDALEARMSHYEELTRLRLAALEASQADQETRIRIMADSVVRLTTSLSLAQVAQAAFALILSAIAAYLGGRR